MKQSWLWLSAITVLAVIGLVLEAIEPSRPPRDTHKVDSFSADLAFIFDCKGDAEPPPDQAIEQFLKDKGFRVLNGVSAANELHADFSWYSMDIIGIDSAHRRITFTAFPEQHATYFVGLYSPPPTHHSTDLEDALLAFSDKTLGCENHQIERHENPANASDVYDFDFKRVEGWYKEVADMKKKAGISL